MYMKNFTSTSHAREEFDFAVFEFPKGFRIFFKQFLQKLDFNYKIKIVCIILTMLRTFSNLKILKA